MRSPGRPSVTEMYTPHIELWLRQEPTITVSVILRRLQRYGYFGGKSALYERVRRLRGRKASHGTST